MGRGLQDLGEPVWLDKMTNARMSTQVRVAQKVTTGVYKGVTTSELDELAAETAASMTATHPDYAIVGSSSSLCLSRTVCLLVLSSMPSLFSRAFRRAVCVREFLMEQLASLMSACYCFAARCPHSRV